MDITCLRCKGIGIECRIEVVAAEKFCDEMHALGQIDPVDGAALGQAVRRGIYF